MILNQISKCKNQNRFPNATKGVWGPNYISKCKIVWAAVLLVSGGCAVQVQKPIRVCEGKKSAAEALSVLEGCLENAVPLRANGKCLAKFCTDGKPHKENFPVKLWFAPPCYLRFQGDVAFNPRGIELGSNDSEFWLSMKPKEIGNNYFWGRWDNTASLAELKISPKVLLEALGIVSVGGQGNWSLSYENGFDVLTKRNEQAVIIKKVYIYNCDWRVKKIEYFDKNGRVIVIIELDKYRGIYENVFVPAVIKVISREKGDTENSFQITLDSIKFMSRQPKGLFNRGQPRGFKHIYEIIDGKMVEQRH